MSSNLTIGFLFTYAISFFRGYFYDFKGLRICSPQADSRLTCYSMGLNTWQLRRKRSNISGAICTQWHLHEQKQATAYARKGTSDTLCEKCRCTCPIGPLYKKWPHDYYAILSLIGQVDVMGMKDGKSGRRQWWETVCKQKHGSY